MNKETFNKIIFVTLLFLWLIFFVNGAFNNSKNIFTSFENSTEIIKSIKLAILLLFSWTWSNLLILSCLASLMGEYGRIAMTSSKKINFIAALVRGFFIYLFIVAGQLIVAGTIQLPKDYPSGTDAILQAYIRLAFVCSLFGFAVGFRPDFFQDFLERFMGQNGEQT